MSDDCYTLADPFGVALLIGAWNYPIQLVLMPLAGAIGAGEYGPIFSAFHIHVPIDISLLHVRRALCLYSSYCIASVSSVNMNVNRKM